MTEKDALFRGSAKLLNSLKINFEKLLGAADGLTGSIQPAFQAGSDTRDHRDCNNECRNGNQCYRINRLTPVEGGCHSSRERYGCANANHNAGTSPQPIENDHSDNCATRSTRGHGDVNLRSPLRHIVRTDVTTVSLSVGQSDVDDEFSMAVPVEIQFGKAKPVTRLVRTSSERAVFTIALRQGADEGCPRSGKQRAGGEEVSLWGRWVGAAGLEPTTSCM